MRASLSRYYMYITWYNLAVSLKLFLHSSTTKIISTISIGSIDRFRKEKCE